MEKKKHKIIKITTKIIMLLIITLILGSMIYSFSAKKFGGEKMPMPLGIGSSVVLSGSMEPKLSVDDMVIIKKCNSYEVGDIVVYERGSTLVIHRIIAINGEMVITQGDANNTPDEAFSKNAIKGKLILTIPKANTFISFIRSPIGIVIILTVAIILIDLSIAKPKKDENYENESEKIHGTI